VSGFEKRIEIRWRDVDAYGHVNNAVYFTYLEEARDAWVEKVLGSVSENTWDFVLARVAIDYEAELTLDDGAVIAACRLESIGHSSVRTLEEIRKEDGSISARAAAVVVARDPERGRARRLTDGEREALEAELASDG
jgi:acyl-CoA thioester hydrolase